MTKIHTSSHPLAAPDGQTYVAEIHGRPAQVNLWEGWIEFVAQETGERLVTSVETSQPDRRALEYWASGVEPLYLEGAFERAHRATADQSR